MCKSWPPPPSLQHACVSVFSSELEPRCGICQSQARLPVTSAAVQCSSRGGRMYNTWGRLQLMHLSCSRGGRKRSQTSELAVSDTSQDNVSPMFASLILHFDRTFHFTPWLQRGVSVKWWCCGAAQALYKFSRLLFSLKLFVLSSKRSADRFCCLNQLASGIHLIQWHFVDSSFTPVWTKILTGGRLHWNKRKYHTTANVFHWIWDQMHSISLLLPRLCQDNMTSLKHFGLTRSRYWKLIPDLKNRSLTKPSRLKVNKYLAAGLVWNKVEFKKSVEAT